MSLARPAVVATAVLAVALTSCTSRETQSTGQSSGGPAASAAAVQSSGPGCTLAQTGYPKVDVKDAIIGFSQSEKEANPFRTAETQSIRDEAAKLGIPDDKLLVTNAQSDLNKQISDIKSLLDRGAQLLVVAPLNSDGLQPALDAAKAKKVPVITIDRKVTSQPCADYLTFIGSDFVEQGKRAARQMARVTGGSGKVAILLGASGNNVTTDRTKGFKDELVNTPGLTVVAEQTGEFDRSKGQAVMEQLIQSNPDITAVYAENDEMGIGAVTALRGAGKQPGKDVKIVSVDGTQNAVRMIAEGSYNAVIESNPRFGPLAFQTLQRFADGEEVPPTVVISDDEYDETNAAQKLGNAY
ncbi:ABC transporter substrate-binding protein [Saccharothrix coeruleofusca]|uniref:LacI family transcriptional regulator n=1 Tax=Saccharothrix coeruleofusca TaxID=33919 RepID=A0A918EFX9_9PSEU|nr:ABC transporter substrate-binding protein [Saccharothrix coeruleofusca]MBP2335384.1 ribose transport system substrate-binding protein [Saccharothrix coeruleofusca]GGP77502.1 LacI family transcriptional regulator [Saccharothrix coeruleofusca]